MPTPLPQISSRAWEHPADRAALNTLRAIPGFDEVVRKVAGFISERGVRQLFLANAVQVGPAQRPALDALLTDVCTTLDWPDAARALRHAVARGERVRDRLRAALHRPQLRARSSCSTSDDERRFLLAHELGHIMSGHMTYRTHRAHPARHRLARCPSRWASRSCPSSSRSSSGTARASSRPTAPVCSPCRIRSSPSARS